VHAEEALARLRALGLSDADAALLWEHFDDAERRGKPSHGHTRIAWLETLEFDPRAEPELVEGSDAFERWRARGAIGYVVLVRAVTRVLASPPERVRVVVCEQTYPTGVLGHHVRRLADAGLVGVLTATSPARLASSAGGPAVAGTNPLAIAIPSSGGDPVVADVSMGAVTWGDVVAGRAAEEDLVPFGGEQSHKAFALALGLQLLVDALVREPGHGAVLLAARPESDPVPALRALAEGFRLPGDG
jgi:LDH2 family malate/lactate/ureidoglycolate dehydrogenase